MRACHLMLMRCLNERNQCRRSVPSLLEGNLPQKIKIPTRPSDSLRCVPPPPPGPQQKRLHLQAVLSARVLLLPLAGLMQGVLLQTLVEGTACYTALTSIIQRYVVCIPHPSRPHVNCALLRLDLCKTDGY